MKLDLNSQPEVIIKTPEGRTDELINLGIDLYDIMVKWKNKHLKYNYYISIKNHKLHLTIKKDK